LGLADEASIFPEVLRLECIDVAQFTGQLDETTGLVERQKTVHLLVWLTGSPEHARIRDRRHVGNGT
jgi:hypothetical protein